VLLRRSISCGGIGGTKSGGCLKWDLGKLMMIEWKTIGERNNVLEKVVEAAIELMISMLMMLVIFLTLLTTLNTFFSYQFYSFISVRADPPTLFLFTHIHTYSCFCSTMMKKYI